MLAAAAASQSAPTKPPANTEPSVGPAAKARTTGMARPWYAPVAAALLAGGIHAFDSSVKAKGRHAPPLHAARPRPGVLKLPPARRCVPPSLFKTSSAAIANEEILDLLTAGPIVRVRNFVFDRKFKTALTRSLIPEA